MRRPSGWLLCALSSAALALGCSGAPFGGTPSPTMTARPANTATPPPTPTPGGTFPATPGVPLELNPIINATLTGDLATLERLTRFTMVQCGPQQGPGSPPPCPPGVFPGTQVQTFPIAGCEGEYRAPESLRATYRQLVDSANKALVGVYEAPKPYLPHVAADYVAVFRRDTEAQPGLGAGVVVDEGRVVGIWFGCQAPPGHIVPRGTDALWVAGGPS